MNDFIFAGKNTISQTHTHTQYQWRSVSSSCHFAFIVKQEKRIEKNRCVCIRCHFIVAILRKMHAFLSLCMIALICANAKKVHPALSPILMLTESINWISLIWVINNKKEISRCFSPVGQTWSDCNSSRPLPLPDSFCIFVCRSSAPDWHICFSFSFFWEFDKCA